MAVKFLDKTGLGYFWGKIKAWCNSTFAAIAHTHTSYAVKHSYTTAANAAKNWYRIANANTSQTDLTKPIHAQFILTAYNASYDTGYYERWFVNAEVFGRTAHIVIFGNSQAPFSQARILYENTIADLDTNDRPAIDIYLNYALANGTTKIEIEEVYNSGWTFVTNGQISASTVPTGFESQACDTIRGNGVGRSNYSDWASYASLQRSNFSANFTLADNNTYRARVLNCTGTITVTVPSINSVNAWFIIKNFNTGSGNITIHPSTTSVLIDGSNDDIILRPTEYIMIHSKAANAYTIVFDGRRRTAVVGRSGEVGTQTKHWFQVAEITSSAVYRDIYISFKVFLGAASLCGGILSAHVRIDGTKGVVTNKQLQWEYKNSNLNLSDFALTNTDTSGTSTRLQIWYKNSSSYASCKFVVIAEHEVGDQLDAQPRWKLTRARKSEGDVATLDTGFTGVVTSTLLTIDNPISGNAATASAVAWSGVTSKPTTIAGYGITDAKIANGTITLGSNSITPLTSHQTLPTLSRTISGSGNAITDITVSNHAITATKGSTFALDNDVIHKDSNEAIEGIKEFSNSYYDSTRPNEVNWESSSLIIRYKNYIKGSGAPSANKYANLLFLDKTGSNVDWEGRLGSVESALYPSGEYHIRLSCYKNQIISESEPRDLTSIIVGYDSNGIKFATAPSTSEDRTEATDILTRDWIPKDTRIVHTSGDETIAGTKTFSSTITGSISGNANTATTLATARNINGVAFDGSANITVADSTKLPLSGGTMTGDITMSASKSIIFDLSATTPTASSPRSLPIQFKSKSIDNDYVFVNHPFFEIPLTQDANYGMGIGFGAGGLTLIGGGEAGRAIVVAESLAGGSENVVIAADSTVDFYTNCNIIANRVKTSIDTSGNFTGKASNVTGTVAIANGGTGATTRLNAVKALTNESVGTDATFFLTITDGWGKAGFTSVNHAKTVLGLKSAAYTESSDYVHMSGNETIGGSKTFSEDIVANKYIHIRNGDVTSGTAPSSSKYRDYEFDIHNSNNTGWDRSAYIEAAWYSNGNSAITMACHNLLDRSKPISLITVGQTASGGQYAKTVTPSANSNTTDIATTEWVNNKGYLTSHQSLANYVTLDGAQTISGAKTFSSNIDIANVSPSISLKDTNGAKGDTGGWYLGEWFYDKDDKPLGYISVGRYGGNTDLHNALTLRPFVTDTSSATGYFEVRAIWYTSNTCAFEPDTSDHVLLGRSPRKWKEVWCSQSSINSSSDIRLKDDIADIPNEVLDAWEDIDWVQFKFKSAKQEKGFNARLHTGTIAQLVDKAFKDHGLNVNEYGLFLYDEWEEVPEVIGEDGTVQQKFQPAGNEYGLRYVEALCMEAAYQRRKNKILENRISELENQLSSVLQILQELKGVG